MSEGYCPKCGQPLGIDGVCYACRLQELEGNNLDEIKRRLERGPICKECHGYLIHSRMNGYYCQRNHEHRGIIRSVEEIA